MPRRGQATALGLLVAVGVLGAVAVALAAAACSAARPAGGPHRLSPPPVPAAAVAQARALGTAREVGQTVIATYAGTRPPASLLADLRTGAVGGVILMGENTPSAAVVRRATARMQAAARGGGHPGVLIMTDQEGGEVQRLGGAPPRESAAAMGRLARSPAGLGAVARLGQRTGQALRAVGIDLDLAPVADVVSDRHGFIATEHRSFGSDPSRVAAAACAFAAGLSRAGVGYTLKHFPGLGDAGAVSTDTAPVTIRLGAARILASDAAYRECGAAPRAVVMVSSASYPDLTGQLPAVLASQTYATFLPADGVGGLIISDSLTSGALARFHQVPLRALSAGLDMAMFPDHERDAERAERALLAAARAGRLAPARLTAAAAEVLALKRTLGLG